MTGRLYGVGVGPGDPELLTLKAHRLITGACVVAYPAPDSGESFARSIAAAFIPAGAVEVAIRVPMRPAREPAQRAYDEAAPRLAAHLDAGRDVVMLCEGDPFFYGSFIYLFERLASRYPCEIVPGVTSLTACAAALGRPIVARDDVLTVLPATLDEATLRERLMASESIALIKLGRHFPKVRRLLDELQLTARAGYVERASLPHGRAMPLAEAPAVAPYFSMILIHRGAEPWPP